jgi:iron complex transport system permease protein
MKVWLVLVLILAVALALASCAGHEWASPFDLMRAFAGDADMRSRLLVEWRMPRVLAAALVGVLLGLGGAVFQGVFRNPLAEPYLLGSAGGAALGATIALLLPLGGS